MGRHACGVLYWASLNDVGRIHAVRPDPQWAIVRTVLLQYYYGRAVWIWCWFRHVSGGDESDTDPPKVDRSAALLAVSSYNSRQSRSCT